MNNHSIMRQNVKPPRHSFSVFPHDAHILRWDVLYIFIVVPSGLLMILFDRFPARNDGSAHWLRALQVAAGTISPLRDPAGGDRYGGLQTDGSFVSFNNTAINSPFLYYPTIISQLFMRNSSSHVQYLSASISTLICCTVCIAVAIRLAGIFSDLIAAVAFLPTVFLSLIFPTADAVTNSFALLFCAVICKYVTTDKLDGWRPVFVLSLFCIMLGQIKTTCLILLLLIGLIFWKFYKREHRIAIEYLIPVLLGILSEFVWRWRVRSVSPWLLSYQEYIQGRKLLIEHPFAFLRGCLLTLIQPLDLSKDQYNVQRNIQLYTGTENTMLPMPVMMFFFLAYGMFVLMAMGKIYDNRQLISYDDIVIAEFILGIIVILFYVLTCAAMALVMVYTSSKFGAAFDGMQSRYFIPVLPILNVMLVMPKWGLIVSNRKILEKITFISLCVGYLGVIAAHVIPFVV